MPLGLICIFLSMYLQPKPKQFLLEPNYLFWCKINFYAPLKTSGSISV